MLLAIYHSYQAHRFTVKTSGGRRRYYTRDEIAQLRKALDMFRRPAERDNARRVLHKLTKQPQQQSHLNAAKKRRLRRKALRVARAAWPQIAPLNEGSYGLGQRTPLILTGGSAELLLNLQRAELADIRLTLTPELLALILETL